MAKSLTSEANVFVTRVGNGPVITDSDIVEPSVVTEDLIHYTSLGPHTGSTIRRLADLKPRVLATMHGASFSGDGAAALKALGDHYDARLRVARWRSSLMLLTA